MSDVDICYNFLYDKLRPNSEEKAVLRRCNLATKYHLIGDRRATRKVVANYIHACNRYNYLFFNNEVIRRD